MEAKSPKTVVSSRQSFITPDEFLKRVDVSTVGDLCADRPAGTGPAVRLTYAQLLLDPNLQAALDDASGDVETALLVGERYNVQDLGALIGTPCVGRARLFRIITEIAKVYLAERRAGTKIPEEFLSGADRAQASLVALAKGVEIFALAETQDAGVMEIKGVSPGTVRRRFGPVIQAARFFGTRSDEARNPFHGREDD